MSYAGTKLSNLINPQVMADMISAKIEKAIVVTPFAKIDNTLVGVPGGTITVPQYNYIGDAATVGEGEDIGDTVLTATPHSYTVVKAAKGVTLSDEAVLSGYGNPVGETNTQLAKAIASKMDADCIAALTGSGVTQAYDGSAGAISYNGIVSAIDVFNEELNTEKVMFVNPKQITTLRKDANFISADKYDNAVIMNGEIGKIANCRIVASKRIVLASGNYVCPIVKIESDERTEDEVPAITIYTKRETNVESERDTHTKTTFISADKHYVAALTNPTKVVKATFKA